MNRQLSKVSFDDPTNTRQASEPGSERSLGHRRDGGEDGGVQGEPGDEPREART
jgi:hypothetical protein